MHALGVRRVGDGLSASFGTFAAGVVLGAGLAMLLAPHSGAETREAIGEKSSSDIAPSCSATLETSPRPRGRR